MRKNKDHHIANICPQYVLNCTNDQCKFMIKREEFKVHVEDKCEHRLIECEFVKYGCNMKQIKAGNLDQHLNDCKFEHISLQFHFINAQVNGILLCICACV